MSKSTLLVGMIILFAIEGALLAVFLGLGKSNASSEVSKIDPDADTVEVSLCEKDKPYKIENVDAPSSRVLIATKVYIVVPAAEEKRIADQVNARMARVSEVILGVLRHASDLELREQGALTLKRRLRKRIISALEVQPELVRQVVLPDFFVDFQ